MDTIWAINHEQIARIEDGEKISDAGVYLRELGKKADVRHDIKRRAPPVSKKNENRNIAGLAGLLTLGNVAGLVLGTARTYA
jgi:hypothetical protein